MCVCLVLTSCLSGGVDEENVKSLGLDELKIKISLLLLQNCTNLWCSNKIFLKTGSSFIRDYELKHCCYVQCKKIHDKHLNIES